MTATAAAGTLTVEGLRRLSPDELFHVFRDLPAPAVGDLSGVFDGHRLAGGNAKMWAALDDEESVRGRRLGKEYRPIDDASATGCNVWRKDRRILRHMRFDAVIGRSYYDGRACYMMRYGPYRNASGAADLVDEVRLAASGLYLALAHREAVGGGRAFDGWFALDGPSGPWVDADEPGAL